MLGNRCCLALAAAAALCLVWLATAGRSAAESEPPCPPFEADPEIERAISELIPWFADPPPDGRSCIVYPILEIWQRDRALGAELARAPWLHDGIGVLEDDAAFALGRLYDRDPALARRLLAHSSVEPVQSANVLLLYVLDELSRRAPDKFETIMRQPWFRDGLTREESALITVLDKTVGVEALFRDLLASSHVRTKTVSLPLAGEVTLWAFHPGPFPPAEDVLAQMERALRGVERMIGAPFPLSDAILLLVDCEAYGTPCGGVNYGDSITVLYAPQAGSLAPLVNHETAHFWLAFDLGPPWLFEGGANSAAEYVRVGRGSEQNVARLPLHHDSLAYCREHGVTNIDALSDPNHPHPVAQATCHYSLGQHFLSSLFNAIGESAYSAALRELYGRYRRHYQRWPSEAQIFAAFRKHAPAERGTALLDLYRRLHGGRFAALSTTGPGYATWESDTASSAAALFPELAELGVAALFRWNGESWQVYAIVDGRPVPGSTDFDIRPGDALYLTHR